VHVPEEWPGLTDQFWLCGVVYSILDAADGLVAARCLSDRAHLRKPASMLRMNRPPDDPDLSGQSPPLKEVARAAVTERVDLMLKMRSLGQALNSLKLELDLWRK
jgi:hypothetical protein